MIVNRVMMASAPRSGASMHLPALPLRLAAEAPARKLYPSCVALGVHAPAHHAEASHGSLEVAVLADDDGIRAFATSSPVSRRVLLERLDFPHPSSGVRELSSSSPSSASDSSGGLMSGPLLCLVRAAPGSNDMEWHAYGAGEEFPAPASDDAIGRLSARSSFHDEFVARLLTESIRLYYAQQVLEPSVRGFLSVLEKQFARSDLYLFELLQNAVDYTDDCPSIFMLPYRHS